jgi:HJR/Mrr/RecB family endonuclease
MSLFGAADALEQVDALHWREFEHVVQQLLEAKGFQCRYVGGKGDHGADVIASKNGVAYAVQVKHRADGRRWVGERAVQAVAAAVPVYKCKSGFVVTNSTFAPGLTRIAKLNDVTLQGRDWLARELASFCELCGVRVSPRVRMWCADHPEYHGNTYCFKHQHDTTGLLRVAEPTTA